jgi:sugar phosphate isomerase/epimerase
VRVGLFTDSLLHLELDGILSWLERELPFVRDLEIGTGGYSPAPHCDLRELLDDESTRTRWLAAIRGRGFRVAALNVSGNPLEDEEHDHHLRRTIELGGLLGVNRVVCMSGGRASLSGGGSFPGIEREREHYLRSVVAPYWASASSAAEAAGLRLCFELEPGAAVYNVSTFEEIADAGEALAVNLDPSHLFWQSMEPLAVVRRLRPRIGFAHGKDAIVYEDRVPLDGRLDRRSWRFATVGDGHGVDWWASFADALTEAGYDDVISVEYEDPTLSPEESVVKAAQRLYDALSAAAR